MNEINDNTWKDIKKWLLIIFSWIILLIFSLIFVNFMYNKLTILGVWLMITGLFMLFKRKDYRKWYENVFCKQINNK